jgi:adenosylhomocysteine nucleosidase
MVPDAWLRAGREEARELKSRIAIVAAMARELRPLLKNWKLESSARGVAVYSSEYAIAVVAGMGKARAEIATRTAMEFGEVHQVISAGLAGGLHAGMTVGTVRFVDAMLDTATGDVFGTAQTGTRNKANGHPGAFLVTLDHVASVMEKRRLRERYSADLVDMEATGVAETALAVGLPFLAVKAVSDDYNFDLPGMEKFATAEGQFDESGFAAHVALRPVLWRPVLRLARNSATACRRLCEELERYLAWDAERSRDGYEARINGVG